MKKSMICGDLFWDMRKCLIVFSILTGLIALATAAAAQTPPQQPASGSPSWTFGADMAPGGLVKLSGVDQAGGTSVQIKSTNDPLIGVRLGLKPNSGFGGEVRYMSFGSSGDTAGSVAQTEGRLILFGADDTPHIVSTAPVLNGPANYTIKSSAKISRIDLLGNYNVALPKGWVSVFAGLPILKVDSTASTTRTQGFLLSSRLPNGSIDPIGIRETYTYSSTASAKATLFGVTGGFEGEYCIASHLILHGRASLAIFPWGSTTGNGQFNATKDVYLVNVAGGINATPNQTVAHLNLLPGANYEASAKQSVTAFDGTVGLKWRFKGEHASFDIGGAITGLSLTNVPLSPSYTITDGFAPGNGRYAPRSGSVKAMAPMITIGVWF